jgi:hypothetical protein
MLLVRSKWLVLGAFSLLVGCVAQTPYDYSALRESAPRSILVLPPLNNSIEVEADYKFLSKISKPLAEKGYYVFPVSVVDQFLKENGLPTPAEMNSVPLDKLEKYMGADAVLYAVVEDWGQKYQVLSSVTVVKANLRLLDIKTGALLWQAQAHAEFSSGDSGGGLAGALANALVQQIVGSLVDRTPELAAIANTTAINHKDHGLLPGPYYVASPEE